jgi:hypothetical protein
MFTPNELKRRALDFSREHATDSDEKSQEQSFWHDFFAVFGLTPQRIGVFEARAKTLRGTVGFIDFFWPGTLLVEHKSRGRDLEEALKQALDYCSSGGLKDAELPRFIVVCDFARFIIVELATGERSEFPLEELHTNLHRFNFILGYEQRKYKDEDPVNIKAAELMGALHDELRRVGYAGHPLELFLVRLMFCFFADDTGIFQKDQFSDYIEARSREDGSDLGQIIAEVFRVLETEPEKRLRNLPQDLAAFAYVNGGLFEEAEDPPYFDAASRAILLHCSRFNWSSVSPAIFGSLFQSVMDSSERRTLGAHYTSEKNILKTIHGLFLDEFMVEFDAAKAKRSERAMRVLLDRIAGIRLLDPACGCGNFLILAYRELRRLEIRIHVELRALSGDTGLSLDVGLERGIMVDHIYGIEISEFPAQIARVALWIMDHLMNVELSATLGGYRPSIPLTTSPTIVQGNALRLDWREIVKPEELSYILGNPPFVGAKWMNEGQREDIAASIGHVPNSGLIDFVGAWYIRATDYIRSTRIQCAFVSTNSITQGEQVGALWGWLIPQGVRINFAHRTFKWTNEAKGNAAVHCIIIGFALFDRTNKYIYDYETISSEPTARPAKNINPYLVDARDIWIGRRSEPICNVPEMVSGNKPIDDGNYLFTPEEKTAFLAKEPGAAPLFRQWLGGEEFLNKIERWCLYVAETRPADLRKLPETMKRIEAVRKFRASSSSTPTQKLADTPTQFHTTFAADGPYIAMPQVSSERRHYIPIAFLTPEYLCGDKLRLIDGAGLFHFGVLTSGMHMAWTRHTCGRLKSDYQYSSKIVYNNFPWPTSPASEKVSTVESAAQSVLDARAKFPSSSLADLYDPLSMPPALVKAHKALDAAVDKCYRKAPFKSELERVEYLFELYEKYTSGLTAGAKAASPRGKP